MGGSGFLWGGSVCLWGVCLFLGGSVCPWSGLSVPGGVCLYLGGVSQPGGDRGAPPPRTVTSVGPRGDTSVPDVPGGGGWGGGGFINMHRAPPAPASCLRGDSPPPPAPRALLGGSVPPGGCWGGLCPRALLGGSVPPRGCWGGCFWGMFLGDIFGEGSVLPPPPRSALCVLRMERFGWGVGFYFWRG